MCYTLSSNYTERSHWPIILRSVGPQKGGVQSSNEEHARYTKRAPSPVALEPCSQTRARPRRRQAQAANLQLGDVPTVPWARHGRFWSRLPVSFGSRAPGAPEALHRVSRRGKRRTRSIGCPTAGGAGGAPEGDPTAQGTGRASWAVPPPRCQARSMSYPPAGGAAGAETSRRGRGKSRRRRGDITPEARRHHRAIYSFAIQVHLSCQADHVSNQRGSVGPAVCL